MVGGCPCEGSGSHRPSIVDGDQQLTVESVCVKAAARRDPCALNPMLPGRRWASWAPGLTERERWDCLAEIADRWSDPSDRDTGLRPGRWDEPTCHSGVYGELPSAGDALCPVYCRQREETPMSAVAVDPDPVTTHITELLPPAPHR